MEKNVDDKIVVDRFFGLAGAKVDSWCGRRKEVSLEDIMDTTIRSEWKMVFLNCEGNYNENGCGALATILVHLNPGETKEIAFLVGMKEDADAETIMSQVMRIQKQSAEMNWKN